MPRVIITNYRQWALESHKEGAAILEQSSLNTKYRNNNIIAEGYN